MRTVLLIICLTLLAAGTAGGLLNDGVQPPNAARILRRSDQVMGNMLVFYVSVEVFSPATGERIESYSMVVHNKHCAESSRDDPDCFCASDSDVWEYFDRAAGGMAFEDPWSENYLPDGTRARDLQIAGDDLVAGEKAWVISYEFMVAGIEGPSLIQRREWISKASYRLLRQEQTHSDARGVSAGPLDKANIVRSELTGSLGFEFPCPMGSELS